MLWEGMDEWTQTDRQVARCRLEQLEEKRDVLSDPAW